VDTVEDGSKAIDYLNANPKPDFILMDMCMPNLDGASAIRQIRQSPAFDDVEIFAVSGQTPKLAGIDMSRNRIANWFQKPLDPRILLSAIGSQSNEAMAN
jgi:CheY-like chemotaxis protein